MIKKRFDPLALKKKREVATSTLKKISSKSPTTTATSGSITTAPEEIITSTGKVVEHWYDTVAKTYLLDVPLPEETRSYKPVSHKVVIEDTESAFIAAGFNIVRGYFTHADEGRMMSAQYYLQLKGDSSDYGHVVSVQNSYNKRITLKFAYGVIEWDSEVGILSNEISFKRKHTGTVLAEFQSILDKTVYMLTEQRDVLLQDVEMLKFTKIREPLAHKLMGQIFFNNIVTSSQLNSIKRKFKKKKGGVFYNVLDTSGNTYREACVWHIYSAVSAALKESHAADQIDNFIGAHEFMSKTFGLI
jgi:hypothetical protein